MRPMEDKIDPSANPIYRAPGFADSVIAGRSSTITPDRHRIAELERENTRLQKLVAELLLKNQQLRKPD